MTNKIKLKMTKEEKRAAKNYALLHSASISEVIKTAFFEKNEDEYDIALADAIHQEMINNNEETEAIEKVWEKLDI